MGRNQIQNNDAVPLGTEYSVPNGTETLARLISSTHIVSLAGQVLFKCVDPAPLNQSPEGTQQHQRIKY